MQESGIRFRAEGESALLKAVQGVDKSLERIEKQARASAVGFEDLTASIKRAAKIDSLTDKIALQNKQLELLQDKLKGAVDKYGESSEQAKRAQLSIDSLVGSIKQNERAVAALRTEDEKERKALEDKRAALAGEKKTLEDRRTALEKAVEIARQAALVEQQQATAIKAAQVAERARAQEEKTAAAERLKQLKAAQAAEAAKIKEEAAANAARQKFAQQIQSLRDKEARAIQKEEEARKKASDALEASLQKERAAYLASVVAKAKAADAAGKAALAAMDLKDKTEQSSRAADTNTTATKRMVDATDQVDDSAERAATGVRGLDRALEQARGGLNAFEQIAIGAFRRVGEVAIDAIGRIGEGLGELAVGTVNIAADYESTLNRFAAVAGSSVEEAGMSLETFNQLALQMGKETQFSAGEAAEAMVNLAKGGIDPATIAAGGLKGTLDLAAAGELDLATAAEISAKQLGIWASEGITGAQVANLLSQAANASTVDVDELALGLANAGGTAKIVGVEYQDLVQTMALLSPGFSSASDAGTSLKVMLSRLVPTTNTAKEAMAELGLLTEEGSSIFFDAQGNFIGMAETAGILQEATKNLSEEQKILYLNTIFGQDAIRAAAILSEQGTKGYNEMGVAMNSAGSAAEQAAIRNQGLNFAVETLKGSFETLQIVIGGAVNPVLEKLINDYLTPATNAVLDITQAIIGGIPSITEFGGIAEDTFDAFRGMKHGGDAIEAIGESFDATAARANLAFEKIEAAVTGFAGKDIGVAFRGMAESAAAAFGSLGKLFSGAGGTLMSAVKGVAFDIINTMTSVFEGVNIFAKVFGGADAGIASGGIGEFIANIAYSIRELSKLIKPAISALIGYFGMLQSAIGDRVVPVFEKIVKNIIPATHAILDIAKAISDGIPSISEFGGIAEDTFDAFRGMKHGGDAIETIGEAFDVVSGRANFALEKIEAIITNFAGQGVGKAFRAIVEIGTQTFTFLITNWEAVKGAIMGVGAVLAGGVIYSAIVAIGSALAALASPITLVIVGAAALGAAWNTNFMGIQETTAAVWGYVTGAFNTAVGYLSTVFGPVISAFQTFGSGALQEIINFVTGTQTEVTNLSAILQSIVTAVGTILTDIVGAVILYYPQWVASWYQMMWAAGQWIWNAIPVAISNLESFLGYLVTWVANSLPTWINTLLTWGIALVQWIADAMPLMITKAGEFLQTLITWATTETQPALQKEATSWGEILYKWIQETLIPQITPKLKEFQEEVVKALKAVAKAAMEQAKKIATQIIDGIVSSLRDGISRVQNAIAELFGAAETSGQEATESHSPSQVFMRIGQNMISGLLQGLQTGNATTGITDTLNLLITTAQSVLGQWTALLARYGQEAWMWITRALPILQAQIRAWGSTLITALGTNLPLWVTSLTPWSIEAWQWLQRSIVPLTGQMLMFTTLLQTWANSVVLVGLKVSATLWSQALYMWIPNELIPGIQPMWQMFLHDSVTNMKIIETEMYKSGKKVGSAIIKGTMEAIRDGKGKIINLFIEVINQAIAAAKRELGIASPSMVFYDIGQQIMFGLRDGIADGTNSAAQALANATGSLSGNVSISALPGSAVSSPATPTQITNRTTSSNSYSNTNNYNLTVNTPRTSQGVQSDFAVIRAAGF